MSNNFLQQLVQEARKLFCNCKKNEKDRRKKLIEMLGLENKEPSFHRVFLKERRLDLEENNIIVELKIAKNGSWSYEEAMQDAYIWHRRGILKEKITTQAQKLVLIIWHESTEPVPEEQIKKLFFPNPENVVIGSDDDEDYLRNFLESDFGVIVIYDDNNEECRSGKARIRIYYSN